MEFSSHRFKALTVSAGFSFWFFIISTALGFFSIEIFVIFVVSVFDGFSGPLFFDDIHITDKGNEVIAEKLFELSFPIVKNAIQQN